MRIEEDIKLDYSDVLIRPKRSTLSSRSEVLLERQFSFHVSPNQVSSDVKFWDGIPIIAANMDGVGTFEVAEALAKQGMMTAITKHYSFEEWQVQRAMTEKYADYIIVSVGISKSDTDQLHTLMAENPHLRFICIDVANGYSEAFIEHCKTIRKFYPNKILIAGNVVSKEITEELILSGVDIVKVGIGPGSVCTTRIKTGVGVPQLSAVIECADAAHGLGGKIIADGGCTSPGDVAKAFAAGADFVMLGGMFAGCTEGGGEIIVDERNVTTESDRVVCYEPGEMKVRFYGMSSQEAQEKHSNGLKNYRASEGKCVTIPYRGPIENVVNDILGGVRSTCTYVGAKQLKDLSKCTTFIRVNNTHNLIFGSHS